MAKNEEIFDLGRKKKNPLMDQPEQIRMTVVIRLSSAKKIPAIESIESSLSEVLPDLELDPKGTEITVSAFPPENFGEDNVLAIVQKHDGRAVIIPRPSQR